MVDEVRVLPGERRPVYNISVEGNENYFADGILTHNCGIIDDPLKNAEEAASEVIRAKQKDWYGSTFYTREEPGGAIVVVQTRWHEDDLSGWLLAQESEDDEPERWHVVSFEAIKEAEPPELPPTCTLEPDPRGPGEALCPERYPIEKLNKIRRRIGEYFFGALFGCRPRPREGNFFKRSWFDGRFVDAPPPKVESRVRAWDKAATDGAGDWTAGVRMSRVKAPGGDGYHYYVEHLVRGRWSPGKRDEVIRSIAASDGPRVAIRGEREGGASGKTDAYAFATMLSGYTVRSDLATGDKALRAGPFASQCEAGNVFLVRGPWVDPFLDELTGFPTGTHDDQIDAAAYAFNALTSTGPLRRAANPFEDDRW